ncbi:hypothetical protein CGCVW01_v001493 [Colletotrichum viniferum]|nr:hypothetical protein CGCVW01_v001493 [Colletotrichum viniferum]
MAAAVPCKKLQVLNGFNNYIGIVRAHTNFSIELLDQCKEEICHAIWGETNPDISGIGVCIGYAIELAVGFLLAAFMMFIRQRQGRKWEFFQIVTKKGLEAFFEFAIYFAVAIELATIIMLVNKDFGISTADFGANEAQNALAIAVMCIIPLVYPIALLPARIFHPESTRQHLADRKAEDKERRHKFRLIMFSLVIVLFFYPFLSQCIHNWAELRVGQAAGGGTEGVVLITGEEYERVKNMCFGDIDRFTDAEHWLLAICEIIASLLLFLFTLWYAMGAGLQRWKEGEKFSGKEHQATKVLSRIHEKLQRGWHGHRGMLLFLPITFGSCLLWCIFRLRRMQAAAAEHMGNEYEGNNWGFGQIVGIIIFAPVVVDMGFAAWSARYLLGWGDYDALSSRESF